MLQDKDPIKPQQQVQRSMRWLSTAQLKQLADFLELGESITHMGTFLSHTSLPMSLTHMICNLYLHKQGRPRKDVFMSDEDPETLPPPPEKPPWQMPLRSSQLSRSHLGLQVILPSAGFLYSVKQGGHWHSASLMASRGLPYLAASCKAIRGNIMSWSTTAQPAGDAAVCRPPVLCREQGMQ